MNKTLRVVSVRSQQATWLRRELNLPEATAFEYVRVARGLRKYRRLFRAFESGVMPYSTVRFLLPFLDEGNEEDLVQLALSLAFSDLKLVLAGAGPKDDEPAEPYARARECDDGMILSLIHISEPTRPY